jgi:ectoine hydroxylase-related dioxygenase (phytanoyl-CoA dioxygenase family)
MPYYNILKEENLNKLINENWYIVLPLLNEDELVYFRDLYKKWHPEPPTAFYKSYFSENMEYKQEVEQAIINKCNISINNHFIENNFELFGAMFVVKPPNDMGHIPPHQDWNFVDETIHWSLNMWLPLQDVNERNGTMRFLKGSHFFQKTIRGANTPEWYDHVYDEIEANLTDVEIKAGEAVFFFHGVVHCSHYNTHPEERICLGLSIVEKDVPIYFNLLKENEVFADKYLVNTDFFMEYACSRGQIPANAKLLGKDLIPFTKMRITEFKKLLSLN